MLEFVKFECFVTKDASNADSEIIGCVIIIHSNIDYSLLTIKPIKLNSSYNFTIIKDISYLYAVFPWKMCGIIGAEVYTKGNITQGILIVIMNCNS